ncbi:MAG: ABC transporter substrate-binding protein [Cyanobacteria bacterium P01_C01_bin.118]
MTENFQLYADALGKSEQAEQLLQDYQDQVQQLQQTLENPQDLTISVIAIANERIGTYTAGSFSGVILNDIGFARNSFQAATWRYGLPLSRESLDQLDGDYIFLIYSSYSGFEPNEVRRTTSKPLLAKIVAYLTRSENAIYLGGNTKKDFITDPIWSQLEAVNQDHVCEVAGEIWAAGRSILAAQQILVDVEECLK